MSACEVTGASITAGMAITGRIQAAGTAIALNLWDATTGTSSLAVSEVLDSFAITFSATYMTD